MTADWEPLGEDVSHHAMSVAGSEIHEDGRQCMFHARLNARVFGWPADKRCLRKHSSITSPTRPATEETADA